LSLAKTMPKVKTKVPLHYYTKTTVYPSLIVVNKGLTNPKMDVLG
jgi:hypothetical protein